MNNKLKLTALFVFMAGSAMAQDTQGWNIELHEVLLTIMAVLLFVLFLLVFTLQKVVYVLKKEALGQAYPQAEEQTFWEKALSLKPLAAEKEIELDHDYDGIKELNNPIPFWFNVLFYGTIIFGIFYLVIYHVTGSGNLQTKEYEVELIEAEKMKQEFIKKAGNLIDENSVVAITDEAKLKDGAAIFASKCAVCHGEKGEGKVGPNLTDAYWIHGGDVKAIFKTIKYGVPSKGMVAWQNSLNGAQMQELTSYILTLQGTNPAGAKEPQGELMQSASAAPVDSAAKQ